MRALFHESAKADVMRSSAETTPIELDDDLTRNDAWMFGPLIATVIALPLVATLVVGFSAWHLINGTQAYSSSPPTNFASRWPDKALPVIR